MNWRELAKKAAEEATKKGKEALQKGREVVETAKDTIEQHKPAEKMNALLEKTGLKKAFEQVKAKIPAEAVTKWEAVSDKLDKLGVNDAAREVKEAFKGLEAKDVANILTDTYKNMSADEALKIGGAIVAPGGIPVYAVVKLVEYRRKQEKEKQGKSADPKPPAPPAPPAA